MPCVGFVPTDQSKPTASGWTIALEQLITHQSVSVCSENRRFTEKSLNRNRDSTSIRELRIENPKRAFVIVGIAHNLRKKIGWTVIDNYGETGEKRQLFSSIVFMFESLKKSRIYSSNQTYHQPPSS